MKQYQGKSVSPGLVLGQVSLLKRETYLFNRSQHSPEKELLVLEEAVRIAQNELDSMAGPSRVCCWRTTPSWGRCAPTYRPAPARPKP